MKAFHSFWSKPNIIRNQGEVIFPDFDLLTAILSALEWRRHNGTIKMITDSTGAAYFEELGLSSIWDEIDTTLDNVPDSVDPFLFWAAGKLYALQSMETPCIMIDTDMIIWKELPSLDDYDVVAAHTEDLNPYVYPGKDTFSFKEPEKMCNSDSEAKDHTLSAPEKCKSDKTTSEEKAEKNTQDRVYSFPEEWDFTLKASNTAFLYLRNAGFRDAYTTAAMEFFNHVDLTNLNPITAMCFAEQRVLPMMAACENQKLGHLLSLETADNQDFITHTWGFKQILRDNPELCLSYCERCVARIHQDFPEYEEMVMNALNKQALR